MDVNIVLVFLLVVVGGGSATAQSCTTSRGITGECTARNACKPFTEIISNKSFKMLGQMEKANILNMWRCGKSSRVCCPKEGTYTEPPPSVEEHRNLGLLPSLGDCGLFAKNKTFGGNKTEPLDYPWMALIASAGSRGEKLQDFNCDGSIINSRYILTTAHCITQLRRRVLLGVRLGEHDLSTAEDCVDSQCAPEVQDIGVEKIITHPKFIGQVDGKLSDLNYDIGLLRLSNTINLTQDNTKPVCLPTTKDLREMSLNSSNIIVTGWGRHRERQNSNELQVSTFPIESNGYCAEKFNGSGIGGIGFRHICVGGQGGDTSCNFKAGAPGGQGFKIGERVNFVQYGILSAGVYDCGTEYPTIFTSVVYYMDWILNQLEP